jgi:hypothetical protein
MVDMITDHPKSNVNKPNMVVVNQCMKIAHFIPTDKTESAVVNWLFLNNELNYHNLPMHDVADSDGVFTRHIRVDIYHILGIKTSMTMAFHHRIGGHTEHLNRRVKHMLWIYCS